MRSGISRLFSLLPRDLALCRAGITYMRGSPRTLAEDPRFKIQSKRFSGGVSGWMCWMEGLLERYKKGNRTNNAFLPRDP